MPKAHRPPPVTKPHFVRELLRLMLARNCSRALQFDLYLLIGQVLGLVHPDADAKNLDTFKVDRFRLIEDGD